MNRFLALLLLAGMACAADLTYTERTQLTGGSMKRMIGLVGRFGGANLGEGVDSTVVVSGNKMANRSKDAGTIFDIDAGTMTAVDYKSKKFSTITFQEMADAFEKMPQAMADAQAKNKDGVKADVKVKVTANDKGAGPSVAGVSTKLTEILVDTTTTFKDEKKGEEATMTTSMKMEQAMGKPQAWETVRDFYKRMAAKMPFRPDPANQMLRTAGLSVEAMNEAAKKLSALDGMPMRSVTQMIGAGQAGPEMPSGKDIAKSVIGGFGGFGRKKKEEPQAQAAPAGPNIILEFTTEVTSIQPGTADQLALAVPAGFKEEEHPMKRLLKDKK
jgi:hypothetical protein